MPRRLGNQRRVMAAAKKSEAMGRAFRESGLGTQGRPPENPSAKSRNGSKMTGSPNQKINVTHNGSDKKTQRNTCSGQTFRPSKTRSLHPKTPNRTTCASAPAFTTRLAAHQAGRTALRCPPSKPKRAAVSAGSGLIKEKIQATQIPQQPRHPGQSAHLLIPVRINRTRLKLVDPERTKTFSPPAPRCPLAGRPGLMPYGTPSKHSAVTGRQSATTSPSTKRSLPVTDLYKRREATGDVRGKSISSSPYQKKGSEGRLLAQRMNGLVLTHKKCCRSGKEGVNHQDSNNVSSIQPQNAEQDSVKIYGSNIQVNFNPREGPPELSLSSSALPQGCCSQEPPTAVTHLLVETPEANVCSFKEPLEATDGSSKELQEAPHLSVKEPQDFNGGSSEEANIKSFKESKRSSDETSGASFKGPKEANVCFFEEAQENDGYGKTQGPRADHQSVSTDKEVTDDQRNSDGLKMSSVNSHLLAKSSQELPGVGNTRVKDTAQWDSPHQRAKGPTMEAASTVMLESNSAKDSGLKKENDMFSAAGVEASISRSPRDSHVNSAHADFTTADNHTEIPMSHYRDLILKTDLEGNIEDHMDAVQPVKGKSCHEDFSTSQTSQSPNSWSDESKLIRKSQGMLFLTRSTDENAIFIPKLKFEFTPDNSIDWTSLPHTGFHWEGQVEDNSVLCVKPCTPHGPSFSKSALKRSIALPKHCPSGLDQCQRAPFSARSGGTNNEHPSLKSKPYPLHDIVDLSLSFEDKFPEQAIPEDIPKILLTDVDEDDDNA